MREFLQGQGKALFFYKKERVRIEKKRKYFRDLPDPPKPCLTIKEKLVRFVNEKSVLSGSNGRAPTLVNMPFSCGQLTQNYINLKKRTTKQSQKLTWFEVHPKADPGAIPIHPNQKYAYSLNVSKDLLSSLRPNPHPMYGLILAKLGNSLV